MLSLWSILHLCRQAFLLSVFSLPATTNASAILPKPSGPYGVSLSTMKLTDNKRADPFSHHSRPRNVMISAFYPGVSAYQCNTSLVNYMPPATAAIEDRYYSQYGLPNGTFEALKLLMCKQSTRETRHVQDFPIVLISPGLGNSRLLYSALAQSISSFGYLVVSIDYPYDANIVEYPDGTLVLGADISTEEQIDLAVRTRAQDIGFVLDQLTLPSVVRQLLPWAKGVLSTHKVTMYGHSLGGAAAAAAILNDIRVIGGANLDGSFYDSILEHHLDRPSLIFSHEGKAQSTDPSWNSTWPRLLGWKLELTLRGAQHATFTDLLFLAKALGLGKVLPPAAKKVLGTLDGTRALNIVSIYLTVFSRFEFKGVSSPLLEGRTGRFQKYLLWQRGSDLQSLHILLAETD